MKDLKIGEYTDRSCYLSYQPTPVHREWVVADMKVISLLEKVSRSLGEFNMLLQHEHSGKMANLFLAREAVASTELDGYDVNIHSHVRGEYLTDRTLSVEIENYKKAAKKGFIRMDHFPFSARFMKEVHYTLQFKGLGHEKMPGEYRTNQTWIGDTIDSATYIPPVPSSIVSLMSDLELFLNDEEYPCPIFIKSAIFHYQLMMIQPFVEGNYRLTRLLVPLFLVNKNLLDAPLLCFSKTIIGREEEYFDQLNKVRTDNNINPWIEFFLSMMYDTLEESKSSMLNLIKLRIKAAEQAEKLFLRKNDGIKLIDFLFVNMRCTAKDVEDLIGKSFVTAYKLLNDMEKMGIVVESTGYARNKMYMLAGLEELI